MLPSLATILAWCDHRFLIRTRFSAYGVAPRQGRYVVRRRILRRLQRRTRPERPVEGSDRTLCHGR